MASGGGEEGAGVAGGVDGGVVSQIDAKQPTESLHGSSLTNADDEAAESRLRTCTGLRIAEKTTRRDASRRPLYITYCKIPVASEKRREL